MKYVIGAVLIFLSGFGLAWRMEHAKSEAARLDSELKLTTAWIADFQALKDRADKIDAAAAMRERDLTSKLQETQNALAKATRGRPCFNGATLGVLDHSTGLHAPDLAGALYGGTAAAAADPANEEEATDTDVAGWVAIAGDYYERCRARIRDIKQYDSGTIAK